MFGEPTCRFLRPEKIIAGTLEEEEEKEEEEVGEEDCRRFVEDDLIGRFMERC